MTALGAGVAAAGYGAGTLPTVALISESIAEYGHAPVLQTMAVLTDSGCWHVGCRVMAVSVLASGYYFAGSVSTIVTTATALTI